MAVAVFVNPSAGRGGAGRKIAAARHAFARRDYAVEINESRSQDEFRLSVRMAIGAGSGTLIAMGGDGTLQLLVRESLGYPVRIGVIPAGGGNDFAAALGISDDLEEAVDVIVRGKTRLVDAVRVRAGAGSGTGTEEAVYLGGGGMGLDVQAVRYASGRFLKWPGRLRYVASAVAALRGFSGLEVQLEFPDSDRPKIVKRVLLAAVLNTPTLGGGLRLAPKARVDDGMLDVVMIEMLRKMEVLTLLPRLLVTGELKTERVVRLETAKVRLSAEGQTWLEGDGELLGISPVELEVMPKALCVLAP